MKEFLSWLENEFGISSSVFKGLEFWQKKDEIHVCAAGLRETALRYQEAGLCFARRLKSGWKLTTNAAQLFGRHATKKILKVNREGAIKFIRGEDQPVKTELRGFVLVKYGEDVLGVGRVDKNTLISMVPKGRRLSKL